MIPGLAGHGLSGAPGALLQALKAHPLVARCQHTDGHRDAPLTLPIASFPPT